MTVTLSAPSLERLRDAILALARALPDSDMVAATRVAEVARFAELDRSPRPVDPRRLH